jgi:hypothetical protein
MKIVWGFIFIGLVGMVFLRWVLDLGRFGFMMIGITICVPAAMGCVLNLHGSQRYWAIAPVTVFFVLAAMIFHEWNKYMKK